ncbi:MAG: siderophore-interacting protein [Rhodobacteraceae bacterium]|nr:siderophore-interacting protein [Paracoccaceae bacterium]PHR55896.1 MAG: NADPH-dependent ferric siderophore reductase [Robiginitomaculum sp.]
MSISTRRERRTARFRRLGVVSNTRLTPNMVRIVLHSAELKGFESPGFDDHIRLFFPPEGEKLDQPSPGERGLIWPNERPEMRDYTPRFFDAARLELTIDFVIHDVGVAGAWAENAQAGDTLGMGGPRGSFVIEGQIDWHLMIGDLTSFPAIARRIEELPEGSDIRAIVEIPTAADAQPFGGAARITWVCQDQGDTLCKHLAALTLPAHGDGFVFVAGEATMVALAREKLGKLGLPDRHFKAANYWRKGTKNAHEH